MANILVVDDEPGIRDFISEALEDDGHSLSQAVDGVSALRKLGENAYDLLITDLRMPGGVNGMDVVREARMSHPETRVIVLTAHGTVSNAVDAIKMGADEFLEKPLSSPTELRILVSRTLGSMCEIDYHEEGRTASERLAHQLQRALGMGYSVGDVIGKGGYASVFRVTDRRLDRQLAAKVLLPEFASAADVAIRFRREARTTARLTHPHIVPVYFVGRERDVPCFVMPYVTGSSVAALLAREGPLAMPLVLRIAREVADALDYAHGMGVVHRDVKPENILIDAASGRVMLADFGIARAVVPTGMGTSPGVFMGTPRYASPEQIGGETDIDERTDVYSLAIVVYEMIAGRVPFDGPNAASIVAQHLVAPMPSLGTHVPNVARRMDSVLAKALAKNAADRFASAGTFVLALDVAARGM